MTAVGGNNNAAGGNNNNIARDPQDKRCRLGFHPTNTTAFLTDEQFYSYFPNVGRREKVHDLFTIQKMATLQLDAKRKVEEVQPESATMMEANMRQLRYCKWWEGEYDDKTNTLHTMRFKRYPMISSKAVFEKAAMSWVDGVNIPTDGYNLDSVGLHDCVNTIGIIEVHNPKSCALSIKQFKSSNSEKKNIRDTCFTNDAGMPGYMAAPFMDDINGVHEFQCCFFCLFIWLSRARPWDRQLEPVWGFFIDNHYFKSTTYQNFERMIDSGTICGQFTDNLLRMNASRFENAMGHMDKKVKNFKLVQFL